MGFLPGGGNAGGGMAGGRFGGIDGGRAVMVVLVIILHCSPMLLPGRAAAELPPLWAVLLVDLCRCAVPFFFIASGFFLNIDRSTADVARRVAVRIGPVYLFWLAFYVLVGIVAFDQWPVLSPDLVLNGGSAFHLWFLPALAASQVQVSFLMRRFGTGMTAAVVLALYAAGPILFAWQGLLGVEYHWRLVPLVRHLGAPAFVFLGICLRRSPAMSPAVAFGLVLLALAMVAGEGALLNHALGQPRVSRDFLWSTLAFGAAAFLFAKNCSWLERFAPLGQMALGIYAVHLIFVWFFRSFMWTGSPPHLALVVAVVAISSVLVVALLRKSRLLSRFVQ